MVQLENVIQEPQRKNHICRLAIGLVGLFPEIEQFDNQFAIKLMNMNMSMSYSISNVTN